MKLTDPPFENERFRISNPSALRTGKNCFWAILNLNNDCSTSLGTKWTPIYLAEFLYESKFSTASLGPT